MDTIRHTDTTTDGQMGDSNIPPPLIKYRGGGYEY